VVTAEACTSSYQCCSLYCTGGMCADNPQCKQIGDPCIQGAECCTETCADGMCQP
jgi:hypothetical protein